MSMPTINKPKNVPGAFHVDEGCNGCGDCLDIALAYFDIDSESGYAFVYRQPRTRGEIAECLEAMAACPTGAIHDDGGFF